VHRCLLISLLSVRLHDSVAAVVVVVGPQSASLCAPFVMCFAAAPVFAYVGVSCMCCWSKFVARVAFRAVGL